MNYLKNTRRPPALRATRRRVLFNFQWPREEETGVTGSGFSNDRRAGGGGGGNGCFHRVYKERATSERVEYSRRTSRNLIKKIRRWRSTTGMRELFCYYILSWPMFLSRKDTRQFKTRIGRTCFFPECPSPREMIGEENKFIVIQRTHLLIRRDINFRFNKERIREKIISCWCDLTPTNDFETR